MSDYHPVILIIMDGVGISREERGNAVLAAKTPYLQKISRVYPGAALQASGSEVGLFWGEMGNSEVGHLNIGAGLIVYQSFSRIQFSIQDGAFFKLKVWDEVIEHAEKNKSAIHLAGLISNGGIHSYIDHLFALLKLLAEKKFKERVFIHFFSDGRDTSPQSALIFLEELQKQINYYGVGKIATVSGRYYAMDRDKRWERTQLAFSAISEGKGEKAKSAKEAIEQSYKQNITDEFIKPTVIIDKDNQPVGKVDKNDAIIFFNFRPDRMRQLTESFIKSGIKNLLLASMTEYDKTYSIPLAFPPQTIEMPLGKIVSDAGKKQLRVAETEKYSHITYFLNGGQEKLFKNEDRILIPSPKVPSYDQKPEMCAQEITAETIEALEKEKYDFIALNFANGDMVSHTGDFKAAIQAMEIIDKCIGKIQSAIEKYSGSMVITADHGNCEEMINLATDKIDTEHSTNPVPCWIVTPFNKLKNAAQKISEPASEPIIPAGILADIAPTILELLGLGKPKEMSGRSLLDTTTPLILK